MDLSPVYGETYECPLFRTGEDCAQTYAEALGDSYTIAKFIYITVVIIGIFVAIPKVARLFQTKGFKWSTVQTRLHVYLIVGVISLIIRAIDPFGYGAILPYPILILGYDLGGTSLIITGVEIVFDWLRVVQLSHGNLQVSSGLRRFCVSAQVFTCVSGISLGLMTSTVGPIWAWHLAKVCCLITVAIATVVCFMIYGFKVQAIITESERTRQSHISALQASTPHNAAYAAAIANPIIAISRGYSAQPPPTARQHEALADPLLANDLMSDDMVHSLSASTLTGTAPITMTGTRSRSSSTHEPRPPAVSHKVPGLMVIIIACFTLSTLIWIYNVHQEALHKATFEKPGPPPTRVYQLLFASVFDVVHVLGFTSIPLFFGARITRAGAQQPRDKRPIFPGLFPRASVLSTGLPSQTDPISTVSPQRPTSLLFPRSPAMMYTPYKGPADARPSTLNASMPTLSLAHGDASPDTLDPSLVPGSALSGEHEDVFPHSLVMHAASAGERDLTAGSFVANAHSSSGGTLRPPLHSSGSSGERSRSPGALPVGSISRQDDESSDVVDGHSTAMMMLTHTNPYRNYPSASTSGGSSGSRPHSGSPAAGEARDVLRDAPDMGVSSARPMGQRGKLTGAQAVAAAMAHSVSAAIPMGSQRAGFSLSKDMAGMSGLQQFAPHSVIGSVGAGSVRGALAGSVGSVRGVSSVGSVGFPHGSPNMLAGSVGAGSLTGVGIVTVTTRHNAGRDSTQPQSGNLSSVKTSQGNLETAHNATRGHIYQVYDTRQEVNAIFEAVEAEAALRSSH